MINKDNFIKNLFNFFSLLGLAAFIIVMLVITKIIHVENYGISKEVGQSTPCAFSGESCTQDQKCCVEQEQLLKQKLKTLYEIALQTTPENKIEGNLYTDHYSSTIRGDKKIENLGKLIINSNNFLEVGFNAGHSCISALHYNPNIQNVLIFDINHHKYTEPTYNKVKEWANNTNFHFVKGDSTKTIPNFKTDKKYDFIHIDGGHSFDIAVSDIINCKKFASNNHILLIDDCNNKNINTCLGGAVKYCVDKKIIQIIKFSSNDADHILAKYI